MIYSFDSVVGQTISFQTGDVLEFASGYSAKDMAIYYDGSDTTISLGGQSVRLSLTTPSQLSSGGFAFLDGGTVRISGPVDGHVLAGTGQSDFFYLAEIAADQVFGGGGNDRIVLSAGSSLEAADAISGGSGSDELVIEASGSVNTASLTGVETITVAAATNLTLVVSEAAAGSSTGSLFVDARMQTQSDSIIVDATAVTSVGIVVRSGAGNDSLNGGGQGDYLNAGEGDDTISGGAGNDTIFAGLGSDTLYGGAGIDTFGFGPGIPRSESYPGAPDRILDFEGLGVVGGDLIDLPPDVNGVLLAFNATALNIPGFDIPEGESVPVIAGDGLADVVWSQNVTTFETRIWVDVDDDGQISEQDFLISIAGTGLTTVTETDFAEAFRATKLTAGNDTYPGATYNNVADNIIYALEGNDQVSAGSGADSVIAADGNDTVEGGTGIDTILGGAGNDSLSGGDDADFLTGGSGVDTINGDGGADWIQVGGDGLPDDLGSLNLAYGGTGQDQISGEQGDDALYGGDDGDQISGAFGEDTLDGGEGLDFLSGGDGNDSLVGGAGADTLSGGNGVDTLDGGTGADIYQFAASATESTVPARDTIVNFSQAEGDKIDIGTVGIQSGVFGNAPVAFLDVPAPVGFNGNPGDTINDVFGIGPEITQLRYVRLPTKSILFADINHNGELDSEDFVVEFTGSSIPAGLTVADFVPGTFKVLVGTEGPDLLTGGAGSDTIYGVDGDDTVLGNDSADLLFGGAGDDSVEGGEGIDSIIGGTGNDLLYGGIDGDYIDAVTGSDTIYGGSGSDQISGAGDGSAVLIHGDAGADILWGGLGADTIFGGTEGDSISDIIGANLLDGGDGDDNILGGQDSDTILGGLGADTITGRGGADSLTGGADGDVFSYDVTLPATDSSLLAFDTITDFNAGAGDRIDLGVQSRFLGEFGGATARFNGSLGSVAGIVDGLVLGTDPVGFVRVWSAQVGADTYLIADLDGDGLLGAADFVLRLAGLNRALTVADFAPGNFEVLVGTDSPNSLTGDADRDTIFGAGGNDTLHGLDDADWLDGGSGNDSVEGGLGLDTLQGDEGQDSLFGGDDRDTIDGGLGSDTLYGGEGGDYITSGGDAGGSGTQNLIYGGTGGDAIYGDGSNDTIYGDADNDNINDQGGANLLDAGDGDDQVDGGADQDTILGDLGDDRLAGGQGNDSVSGGVGFDTVSGGEGKDVLTGGADGDVFGFIATLPGPDSSLAAFDTVTDYDAGQGDRIDLGSRFRDQGQFGFAPAVFGGGLGQVGVLDGLVLPPAPTGFTWVYSARIGTDTYLIADLDQDGSLGATDFVVRFTGINRDLNLGDFVDGTFKAKVGTEGDDAAAYFTPTGEGEIFFGQAGNDTIEALDGSDFVEAGSGNDSVDGGLDGDTLNGGTGNDVLLGNDGGDTIDGGLDSDTIFGGNEADLIYAGGDEAAAGAVNLIFGGFGADAIYGDESADTLSGDEDDDGLYAGGGADAVSGGTGDDNLNGDTGNDSLDGGAGVDNLYGGAGADELIGGTEADIFHFDSINPGIDSSVTAMDAILDFDAALGDRISLGTHQVTFGEFNGSPIRFEADLGPVAAVAVGLALPDGSTSGLLATRLFFAQVGNDAYAIADLDADGVLGTGDFVLKVTNLGRALTADDFVDGTFGVQVGTGGNDGAGFFVPSLGDDRMLGLTGNDTLDGSDGSDRLYGGDGNDSLSGGVGFDTLIGDDGNDILDGGGDADTIDGGLGADTINGGDGGDYIFAGSDDATTANQIFGGFGDDAVTGGEGADLIDGGLDDDFLQGNGGNDTILGQTGADNLYGGGGADSLSGGTLADTLYGDSGNDTLDGGSEDDAVFGGQGYDTAVLAGNRADYVLTGSAAEVTATRLVGGVETDVLAGIEAIQFANGTFTLVQLGFGTTNAPPTVGGPVDLGGSAEDASRLITEAELLAGASDADSDPLSVVSLTASSGALVANGDGTWTFTPASNDDTAVTFSYSVSDGQALTAQTATLDLTPQNDDPVVGAPVVLPALSEDGTRLITTAELAAGTTDVDGDTLSVVNLVASSGALTDNGDGTWTYTPASNDDTGVTFTYDLFDGSVTVAQTATLDLTPVNDAPVGTSDTANTALNTALVISAAVLLGNDSDVDTAPAGLTIGSVQNGANGTVVLNPNGSVTFTPTAGFSGAATFFYRPFDGLTLGSLTEVSVTVSASGLVLTGTSAANLLIGSTGDDTISGLGGNDTLDGQDGNDFLIGGGGNDALDGGSGDDSFRYATGSNGFDVVEGGAGSNDQLVATANNVSIGLASLAGVEFINAAGFTGLRVLGSTASNSFDFSAVTLTGVTLVDLGSGNDSVVGSVGNDRLLGGSGNDNLQGGEGDDVFIFSGTSGGFDVIAGGIGTDTVLANSANTSIGLASVSDVEVIDAGGFAGVKVLGTSTANLLDFSGVLLIGISAIDAGSGNDTVIGSSGNDTIVAGAGSDVLDGGEGDDLFLVGASAGTDTFAGGSGINTIRASAANVSLTVTSTNLSSIGTIDGGGFANFRLVGTSSGDRLDFSTVTLSGIAAVTGGNGNDTITGSISADVIEGGSGRDSLSGGLGADVFDFNVVSHSRGSTIDRILDFSQGSDIVDLSTIDADGTLGVADSFVFIGNSAFSGVAGQLRVDTTTIAGVTRILADLDANQTVDMEIQLTGVYALTAGDFLL